MTLAKHGFLKSARQVRKAIKTETASVLLANASYTNMLFSIKTLFRVIGEAIT